MKRYLFIALALAVVVTAAGYAQAAQTLEDRVAKLFEKFFARMEEMEEGPTLGGGFGLSTCEITASTGTSVGSFSTTTLFYLSATGDNPTTASTTLSCDTKDADLVDINLNFRATSTATVLMYEVQFSHNNVDWFAEDTKSVDSTIATSHGKNGTVHTISVDHTATTTRNIGVDPVASRWMRVRFMVRGGNGVIWAIANLRKPVLR